MNRHLKVSLTLTALSLTTIGLLTSCNSSTDLEGKLNANQAEIQNSLNNAIKKAESELASAKTELQGWISAGDATNAQELSAAVKRLDDAITAASKLANDGDSAAKAELLVAINDAKLVAYNEAAGLVQAAKKELNDAFASGDSTVTAKITTEVTALRELITAVENLAKDGDEALTAELDAAIAELKVEVAEIIKSQIAAETLVLKELVNEELGGMNSQITTHVNNLNAAVETGKVFAAESDAEMKNELIAAINAAKNEATETIAMQVALMSEELTALIEEGDKASVEGINDALAKLNADIETAKKLAEENDVIIKDELYLAIAETKAELKAEMANAIALASDELKELLAAHEAADAEALKALADEFQEMIDAVDALVVEKDLALKAELDDKLAAADAAIEAELSAVKAEMAAMLAEFGEELLAEFNAKFENADFASREEMTALAGTVAEALAEAKQYAYESDEAIKAEILNDVFNMLAESSTAFETAMAELAAEIRGEMEAGLLKSADDLASATEELRTMIEAMGVTAAAGDATVKAELLAAIEASKLDVANVVTLAMESALAEIENKISSGDAAVRAELADAIVSLQELIRVAEDTAKTDNEVLEAKLAAAIESVRAELSTMVDDVVKQAVADLEAKLEDQKNYTDASVKAAFDELKGLIDALESNAGAGDEAITEAFQNAIHSAYENALAVVDEKLAALKTELEEAIANTDLAVDAKAAELTALINGVNEAFANADVALKDELAGLIDNTKNELLDYFQSEIEASKNELLQKIEEGDKASADAVVAAKIELENKLADIKVMYEMLKKQDDEFHQKFNALQAQIKASIEAVADASMKLDEWGVATDALVESGLDRLETIYASYEAKKDTYIDDDFSYVRELYTDALVRLIRATSINDIENVLADFDAKASELRTWQDKIYDALMAVGKDVSEVEYDADGEGLLLVNKLLADARAIGLDESYITAYPVGDSVVNLQALYDEYYAAYVALGHLSDGAKIKADMDAIIGPIMWNDVELYNKVEQLLDIYKGWAAVEGNDVANVEGFEETVAKVQAMYDRYWKLDKAKTYADEINEKIAKAMADVEKTGATWANDFNVNSIVADVDGWIAMFFSGEYASEIKNSANYDLLDHSAATELVDTFNFKVAEFKAEAEAFKNAVLGIGDEVNLLSWDEINAALTQYGDFVMSRDLNDFTYLFDEGETPAKYYELLVRRYGEYRTLKASAYNDYLEAADKAAGLVVSIYDGEKIDAMLAWYETYGVKDAEGNFVFDNGAAGSGYVLSGTTTITASDYDAVATLKSDYDALRAAKIAEVEDIYTRLETIADNVTYGQRFEIKALRDAFDGYLSGANVPAGYTAEQFAINDAFHTDGAFAEYVVTNAEKLILAEEVLADLIKQVNVIKAFIATGMKDYQGYGDFVDAADRDNYDKFVKVIEGALDKFYRDNGYSYDDAFTADELAKVATARLAIQKYDATADLVKYTPAFLELVLVHKLPEADKDVLTTVAYGVYADSAYAIDMASDYESVQAAHALAYDKFAAIHTATQVYDEYLAVFTFDDTLTEDVRAEVALKMSLSFETTVNRIVVCTNKEDVDQNVKFVADELESLYSIKGLQ